MSEYTLGNGRPLRKGDGSPLREGDVWVLIHPFTPQERWMLEEDARRQGLLTEPMPRASGPALVVTKVDVANKTVTLEVKREDE